MEGVRSTIQLVVISFVLFSQHLVQPADCATLNHLPRDVLHHVLYVEPNNYLAVLANVSDLIEGGLKRTFLRPGHRRAATLLQRWMVEAGMLPWVDAVGNVRARTASSRSGASLMIGSHYDTVIDGGPFDGALGIIAGIAAVKATVLDAAVAHGNINATDLSEAVKHLYETNPEVPGSLNLRTLLTEAPPMLRRPIEITAFSDEEGVRFQSTFLGSLALAGKVSESLLASKDPDGVTLKEALEEKGMDASPEGLRGAMLSPGEVDGYVEVHIEQGPVLQAVNLPLGTVSAIAGQTRLLVSVVGSQGHAGTVPMQLRKDPLATSAELISQLETICGGGQQANRLENKDVVQDSTLVCTVGSISLWPNASNVIPGRTNFTIDIRSRSDEHRVQAVTSFQEYTKAACDRRGMSCLVEIKHDAEAVHCNAEMVENLSSAITSSIATLEDVLAGESKWKALWSAGSMNPYKVADSAIPPPVLVSGAGHDAMIMANLTKTGMIFVRCKDGISHSPEEYVAPQDVAASVTALYEYIRRWEDEEF